MAAADAAKSDLEVPIPAPGRKPQRKRSRVLSSLELQQHAHDMGVMMPDSNVWSVRSRSRHAKVEEDRRSSEAARPRDTGEFVDALRANWARLILPGARMFTQNAPRRDLRPDVRRRSAGRRPGRSTGYPS